MASAPSAQMSRNRPAGAYTRWTQTPGGPEGSSSTRWGAAGRSNSSSAWARSVDGEAMADRLAFRAPGPEEGPRSARRPVDRWAGAARSRTMQAMPRPVLAALCLAAAACGGDPGAGQPGGAAYRLAAASDKDLVLHPGETRTLRVVLARDQVGGVANALVHFEMAGDPGAFSLASQDATTGEGGVASVALTAGPRTASAELIASAPGFDAPEVAFTVEVVPARKLLEVVAGPGTLVDPGGQSASVTVPESGSAPLRVREIDFDTGPRSPATRSSSPSRPARSAR